MPSAKTGQRGAHDGALVKKEGGLYGKRVGLAGYGYVRSISFTAFILSTHSSFYQVRQNTHSRRKEAQGKA